MTIFYHGTSRTDLSELSPFHPEHAGMNTPLPKGVYISKTFDIASAFAFRDTWSHRIESLIPLMSQLHEAKPIESHSTTPSGTVYLVNCDAKSLCQDPDFQDSENFKYSTRKLNIWKSAPSTVYSWREFYKIIGPYKTREDGNNCYDSEGFINPPTQWKYNKNTSEHLRKLGPWFPYEAVHFDWEAQEIVAFGDYILGGLAYPIAKMFSLTLKQHEIISPYGDPLPPVSLSKLTPQHADILFPHLPIL